MASALVEADRCGHSSHGVRQLPYYVERIEGGELAVDTDPAVMEERGGLLALDGRHGFGQIVGERATGLALEGAARHAVSAVAVRNAGHIGRLGAFTERIADAGMVGILLVNFQGGDQLVAPFGSFERRLGNNPISIGVPGPAVLDIALSVAAEGRVYQAQEHGEALPDGWILDREGSPSTEPSDYLAGGSLLPAGGHKGYGLIVLVEMVVGLLTLGGMSGPGDPPFSNAFVLRVHRPGRSGPRRLSASAARVRGVGEERATRCRARPRSSCPGSSRIAGGPPPGPSSWTSRHAAALGELARRVGISPPGA